IPLLIEKYNNKIVSLLEEESIPVKGFVEMCSKEVFETLEGYDFKDKFRDNIIQEFNNLDNRVEGANSFAVLSSMSDLAEKVKLKWIKEIVAEDVRLKRIKAKEIEEANRVAEGISGNGETDTNTTTYKVGPIPEVVIKTKTLSMRELVKGQKTIKNNDDIDEVVEALRKKLREELEKDTIISLV
ncbi:BREX system P-loop protein BrxC, partial [Clostridium beijerinckii]|nr:BREX system P-loop protein BrxC [Clostridium beijerinckii]